LLIAGNKGKMGAALMAVKACLRSGAGLTTLSVEENFLNAVHSFAPEAMCIERNELIEWNKFSATGIGPGLGTESNAEDLVKNVLENGQRLTLDADALNILSKQTAWLQKIPAESILTPHPKEFERLFGKTNNEFERIELAIELSKKQFIYNCSQITSYTCCC